MLSKIAKCCALLGLLPLATAPALAGSMVYTMTNDPVENGNAILAYEIAEDGQLTLSGRYPTGGAGWRTPHELPHFGPFDIDQPVIIDRDSNRLFAVNGGSDSIAVFDIGEDGALAPVPGSPFASGGVNPASIGHAGDRLVVVNKNADPDRDMSATRPNYSVFEIAENGALAGAAGGYVVLDDAARSPTQALVVREKFVFDGDFGSFWIPAREAMWGAGMKDLRPSLLRALRLEGGKISLVQELEAPASAFEGGLDTDQDGVPDPLMFGLMAHPSEDLLYVSFVTAGKLGVYAFDETGALSFLTAVPNSGGLICWVLINADGTRAYTTNNGDDSVSVYDLTDPRAPKEIQHLALRGYGAPYQLGLTPDETHLIISKHRTFPTTPVGDGSVLNVLSVAADGTLEEVATSPVTVPSRGDLFARPMGVATY
ncbi:MAG: hypothetical protein AAFR17_10670 [Pseudomonadota bacterium]